MTLLQDLQGRCALWIGRAFGLESLQSQENRAARVMEEAVELAQAAGVGKCQALRIVDRAYSRPAGDPKQETAGVLFTLLAWCEVTGIDPVFVTQCELNRVESIDLEHFRAKQREKFAAGTDLIAPVSGT